MLIRTGEVRVRAKVINGQGWCLVLAMVGCEIAKDVAMQYTDHGCCGGVVRFEFARAYKWPRQIADRWLLLDGDSSIN